MLSAEPQSLPEVYLYKEKFRGTDEYTLLQQRFEDLKSKYTTRGLVLLTLKSGVIFDKPIEEYQVDEWIYNLKENSNMKLLFIRYYFITKQWAKIDDFIGDSVGDLYLYDLARQSNTFDEVLQRCPTDLFTFLVKFTKQWKADSIEYDDDTLEQLINDRDEFNIMRYYYRDTIKEMMRDIMNEKPLVSLSPSPELSEDELTKIINVLQQDIADSLKDSENLQNDQEAVAYIMSNYNSIQNVISVSADVYLAWVISRKPMINMVKIDRYDFRDFSALYFKDNLPSHEELQKLLTQHHLGLCIFKDSCGLLVTDFQ